MRTVDHEPGILADHLDPRRPLERGKTANDVVARDREARLDFGQTGRGPPERRRHCGPGGNRATASVSCPQSRHQVRTATCPAVGRASGGTGGMSSYQKSESISRSEHRRWRATRRIAWLASASRTPLIPGRPRLRIPAFSVAIRRQGISQLPRVIERDARDDREDRTNHVRRVEPAAQADFEHDGADLAAGEVQQAHRRGDLKERGTAVTRRDCLPARAARPPLWPRRPGRSAPTARPACRRP